MTAQTLLPARDSPELNDPIPPRSPRRAAWRFALIAYGLPVAATVLATLTWFSPGRFVANGDIAPFVRQSLAGEVTQSWSHQATGAGSTSVPILQLVEVVLVHGVRLVGLDAPVAQWLLYALCFGLCAFGAAYLAGGWVRHPLALAAAGLLAAFNPYVLALLPNPLPGLAIGLTGLLAGMAVRAAAGRRVSPIGFAAASLPASYLALNPPWLLMTVMTVLFVVVGSAVVGGRPALRRSVAMLLRALPWVLLLNLWWIVPFAHQLFFPAGTAFSADTDVRDWAWTHQRDTAANVVTLRALWLWDLFPYAKALNSGLRSSLGWALPILAFTGVVLAGIGLAGRRRRRGALLVAGIALVLLFLSTGLRSAQFGWVNLWLYDHVPGMWLIRDPASKLGVPTVLLYTALAALAVDRAIDLRLPRIPLLRRLPTVLVRLAPRVAVAGVVLAALAYPSPMWTGSVVPNWPQGEVSHRVVIPQGWQRLADTVNADPSSGKVLTLPVNLDYYSVATNWGYRGVDVIPSQLLKRPTLHLLPGGYYDDTATVKAMLIRAQNALLAADGHAWRGALRALGVDTVIVRHDLKPASFGLPSSADPDALDAALAGIGNAHLNGRFGVASLYRMADGVGVISAGNRLTGVHAVDATSVADAVAGLPAGNVAVNDPDQPVTAFRGTLVDSGTMTFTLAAGGPFRLDRTGRDASYRATVTGRRLVLADADTIAVDGRPLPVRPPLAVELAEPNVVGIDVGGELRVLPTQGDVVAIAPNTTLTAYAAQPGNGLSGPFQTAADCGGTPAGASDANPLRLAVKSGRRCAAAAVQPTAGATYRVHYSLRNDGGATARMCLWQDGPKECAPLPSPPVAADWTEYTAITRLAPNVGSAWLYLYAEGDVGPGIAEFRDVTVTPLRPVGSATLSPRPAPAENITLAAGRHTVTLDRKISAVTSLSPQFRTCGVVGSDSPRDITGDRPIAQPDGSLVLHDPGASACAEAAVIPAVPGATYRLSADYFTHFGGTPRICLHQFPSGRCAQTPALARVAAWRTVNTLVRPMPDTTYIRAELYSYANYQFGAKDLVNGRASFRNFHLTRVSPVSVSLTAADPAPPRVTAVDPTAVSSSEYRVAVHGAAGQFTLTLADSYASGWTLDGLPAGWSARHIAIDGFANGWLVEGTGDATLTIRYRPALWAFAALATSLLAGLAVGAIAIGQPMIGVARRRGWLGLAGLLGRSSSRRRTPPPRRATGDS